jgi:hypothetical protein
MPPLRSPVLSKVRSPCGPVPSGEMNPPSSGTVVLRDGSPAAPWASLWWGANSHPVHGCRRLPLRQRQTDPLGRAPDQGQSLQDWPRAVLKVFSRMRDWWPQTHRYSRCRSQLSGSPSLANARFPTDPVAGLEQSWTCRRIQCVKLRLTCSNQGDAAVECIDSGHHGWN